jgi:hypothetical protein
VDDTCQCVNLGGACDPANNLCCQTEETLCPAQNAFGNVNTCCRPQGRQCSTAADCCEETYAPGRDSCGADGRCGGNDADCGEDGDCVEGLECWGLCTREGQGPRLCRDDLDCPAGQPCSQRRCVDPTTLPD